MNKYPVRSIQPQFQNVGMFCKIEKQITMFKLRKFWILGKDHFEFDLTDILKVTTSHTLNRRTLSY